MNKTEPRAKMVEEASDYNWSSYHHNALGKTHPLIQSHLNYYKLGATPQERKKNYQALFQIPLEQ